MTSVFKDMLKEEQLQTDYTIDTVTHLKQELTKHAIWHTYDDIVTAIKKKIDTIRKQKCLQNSATM